MTRIVSYSENMQLKRKKKTPWIYLVSNCVQFCAVSDVCNIKQWNLHNSMADTCINILKHNSMQYKDWEMNNETHDWMWFSKNKCNVTTFLIAFAL